MTTINEGAFSATDRAAIASANAERTAYESGQPLTVETPAEPVVAAPVSDVPEKFRNADGTLNQDALLRSYSELEKKQSQPKGDETAQEAAPAEKDTLEITKATDGEKPQDEAPKAEDATEGQEVIAGKVVTEEHRTAWTGHLEAFSKDGKLPDDAFEFASKEFGITDKSIVEAYARGQIAEQQLAANAAIEDIVAPIGGKAEYAKVADWASKNLTDAELADFNSAVASGTQREAKLAIQNLKLRFDSAEPAAPAATLAGDTSTSGSEVVGYNSFAEMTAAMNKLDDQGRRLYDKDATYRASVDKKVDAMSAARSSRR